MNADHPAPDAAAIPAPQPLPGQGVLEVAGADAERFLQGQLTNDLRLLTPESLLLAGYQTPQGRVLAVLRVVRAAEGFLILLPRGLAGELATRLARYTLRAKVRVEDASERYAASGTLDAAFARLCEAYGATPAAGQRHLRLGSTSLVDRGHGRSLVLCSQGEAPAVAAEPRGGLRWMQAGIRAGDPEVWPAASEAFTAHMLNLDLLSGISFTKGCYTGQEIVARTEHLGRVKRRMFRYVATREPGAPAEIAPLSVLHAGDAKVGEIVTGVRIGETLECLAVVSLEARDQPLTGASGLVWAPAPLPYAVPG